MSEGIIVSIVVAVFASTGFWAFLNSVLLRKNDKKTASDKVLLSLSHDKLFYLCTTYIRKGYMSSDEYENLEYLFKAYVELGGNGLIKKLHEQAFKLPIKDDEYEESA